MAHRFPLIVAAYMVTCAHIVSAQPAAAPPAHVTFVDGSATVERDRTIDVLTAGMPVVPGDRLRTTVGRLELLFDDGSTLFVDDSSILDLLSSASLRLWAGALTFDVSRGFRGSPTYQVDTPAGSVFLTAPGEYNIVGQTEQQVSLTRVQVARGAADLVGDNGRTTLTSGEESLVRSGEPPAFPVRFNSARSDFFGQWVESRRMDREVRSASRQYLPPAVQTYATTLDRHGSWISDTQFGVVWYPTVVGNWRPYDNGRWTWIAPYGWTWVGADAWAWPTGHYGRWCTNASGSWFWIPGTEWGRAAPTVLQARGGGRDGRDGRDNERRRRNWPGDDSRARAAVVSPAASGLAPAVSSAGHGMALNHRDSLVRPLPPIGLPHPMLGLPPRQAPGPSAPAHATGSVWAGSQDRGRHRRTFAPPSAIPGAPGTPGATAPRIERPIGPAVASRPALGWAAPTALAPPPRSALPAAPPMRPQFGAYVPLPGAPRPPPRP